MVFPVPFLPGVFPATVDFFLAADDDGLALALALALGLGLGLGFGFTAFIVAALASSFGLDLGFSSPCAAAFSAALAAAFFLRVAAAFFAAATIFASEPFFAAIPCPRLPERGLTYQGDLPIE